MDTVWVLGDQLNRAIGAMAAADPDRTRVLMVESDAKIASKPFHRQRLHLVIASMRAFAAELRAEGFEVDYVRAASLAAGLDEHRHRHRPAVVRATEPASWAGRELLAGLGVELIRSNQFLCHYEDFARWAGDRRRLRMEDFYRWRRTETGYLMDGDRPAGGRWNFDSDNRRPSPNEPLAWPRPSLTRMGPDDAEVVAGLPPGAVGAAPTGLWATTRRGALARLRHAVDEVLPRFGPHQDVMLDDDWHLAHTLISPYLNIGLLLPGEVCDAVEDAYRAGRVPIASAEGFLRQVLGWREYVWGVYWLWMPGYRDSNHFGARRPVPPALLGAGTRMRCVANAVEGVEARAYAHHIQRLMILGNLALLAGIDPRAMVEWMWSRFVDGAEWVMLPNVIGMALHADGGRMATKPYAAGGAYISRMSDHCRGCAYDPKKRTGDRACPYTTLYWDFLARHRDRLAGNHRMVQAVRNLDRLADLPEVRARAAEVLERLDAGTL
ncbi:MAG TPA: cryptochrome/photolyase family protein [Acidimicrobiales bacterium]|nr:cryptochrome/photolyase family protein [Acidimicrobiales bacterium]